jgi:hypothetical protein
MARFGKRSGKWSAKGRKDGQKQVCGVSQMDMTTRFL